MTPHGFFLNTFSFGGRGGLSKNVYFAFLKFNFVISDLVIVQPPSVSKSVRKRNSIKLRLTIIHSTTKCEKSCVLGSRPSSRHERKQKIDVELHSIIMSVIEGGERLILRSGCFYSRKISPVQIEQEGGVVTEPFWKFCRRERLFAHAGIRSPDYPFRSPL